MRNARAFSLVEVLIAIVVLALGLLGLAAVFPAVVTQQRAATDAVMATSMENSITDYLRGNSVFNKASELFFKTTTPPGLPVIDQAYQRGWQVLTDNAAWSRPVAVDPATGFMPIFSGDWSPIQPNLTSIGIGLDPLTGDMRIAGTDNGTTTDSTGNHREPFFTIPISQRLYPTPYASPSQPLYVWDFVARRVPAGFTPPSSASNPTADQTQLALQDDSVQFAIFVRRIDTGIRKPSNKFLSDVLTGTNLASSSDRRVPVAEQTTDNRPTYDGLGGATASASTNYSGIHKVEFALRDALPLPSRHTMPDPGSYIQIDPNNAAATLAPYARQVGQKLVDSFGVVHTVTAFLDRDPRDPNDPAAAPTMVFEITPPIDKAAYDNWVANAPSSSNPPHLWFTTQIPTTVFVVTIPTPTPGTSF
jgi:prepilin-type N-terminal cleavage/methylation domain-containing protein